MPVAQSQTWSPESFWSRAESERWEPGTPPTLIQNATIWTGGDNGDEVVLGDILLDKGIIKAVGEYPLGLDAVGNKLVVKNVQGAWVSPGDHLGVDSVPELRGAADTNSLKAPTMPYLRSLDGFNTHDTAFALSRSGGVATALILLVVRTTLVVRPLSLKFARRVMADQAPWYLSPPRHHINGTRGEADGVRWRHIKHGYNSAREVKQQQDAFCAAPMLELASHTELRLVEGKFPEDLQFEALVDVLRGRVKVTFIAQAVDFDGILTNEFKFPSRPSITHTKHTLFPIFLRVRGEMSLPLSHCLPPMHDTIRGLPWLGIRTQNVPDILKSAWGDVPPAVALFATNARYKYEAYRGSEFAPKILHDNGFRVVMKSDHPVLNSRYLLYEAAQAHYGLPAGPALSSVITTPAEVAGFGHRLGRVQNGYDADIVVWDSHPLTLGATPKQLYIDGIAQLSDPVVVSKPSTFQRIPATPNWGKAPQEAVEYDGLPPLQSNSGKDQSQAVVFTRVKDVWTSSSGELQLQSLPADSVVVVSSGRITCVGSASRCSSSLSNTKVVDLAHGSLSPGLISFGAPLGLEEISAESSTNDGTVPDPFDENGVPKVAGGDDLVDEILCWPTAGVTTAVSAPVSSGLFSGASVAFRTGASHKLEDGAIVNSAPALHLTVGHGSSVSVSTQIATLRRLLLKNLAKKGKHDLVAKALGGQVPLVIKVHKADDMATLLELKSEIEDLTSVPLRLTFAGATEAHLIAKEIAEAGVGVIVIPSRSFPSNWDQARVLPGPPLSRDSLITKLLKANVTVGLGVVEAWEARNTRFDIGWAALESDGDINKQDALALGTTNLQKLLGLEGSELLGDLIAYHGGDCFDLASRPVAVVSAARGTVDLF
ncbi:carbohydrate esterase family 9 protein [Rhizoctonia solani]|uniref:Carbohydrate esterase family 9 protein n=1 Tax=Rhizoctonia solani TaxID=456999 RepID=A0A8H8SYQ0_9AGAM|nr:carbohydrate esterase family 9 protein [Rhizoctonia solani]QRW21792.1 carbohydrate esterase family 9 protein [Rhizoctonia solani]